MPATYLATLKTRPKVFIDFSIIFLEQVKFLIRECLILFVGEGRQVKQCLSSEVDDEMLIQHIYKDHTMQLGEMKILLLLI